MEKLKSQYRKEKLEKGFQLYPDVAKSKEVIANNIYEEVKHAMQEERMMLAGRHNLNHDKISLRQQQKALRVWSGHMQLVQ